MHRTGSDGEGMHGYTELVDIDVPDLHDMIA
jgi:hypothetical protein